METDASVPKGPGFDTEEQHFNDIPKEEQHFNGLGKDQAVIVYTSKTVRLVSHELWPLRDIVDAHILPMKQLHKLVGFKPPHATRIGRTECHEVKLVSFFVIPPNTVGSWCRVNNALRFQLQLEDENYDKYNFPGPLKWLLWV